MNKEFRNISRSNKFGWKCMWCDATRPLTLGTWQHHVNTLQMHLCHFLCFSRIQGVGRVSKENGNPLSKSAVVRDWERFPCKQAAEEWKTFTISTWKCSGVHRISKTNLILKNGQWCRKTSIVSIWCIIDKWDLKVKYQLVKNEVELKSQGHKGLTQFLYQFSASYSCDLLEYSFRSMLEHTAVFFFVKTVSMAPFPLFPLN